MSQPSKYQTPEAEGKGDFRDRGSKFLSHAYPVRNTDDVKTILHTLKKEHPKAVHHCYAYRLGTDGMQYRANDDGEPSGSAGKPILGQIDSAGLTDVLVVVVRYFGGTLLGVPGLINAYKTATTEALTNAGKTERWIERIAEIQFDYPVMGEVLHLLKSAEATLHKQDLQLFCAITAGIPVINYESCAARLSEIRGLTMKAIGNEKG